MHRKKILIVTDNLQDQINGVVTTYKNIEACAILDGYSFVYLDPGWFNFIDCPKYHEVKLAYPRKIWKKIKEISPDHIHIATEGPIGVSARFVLDRHNIRYNTAYHTRFPEGIRKLIGIPEAITWSYVRWFHKHSGKVMTTTMSMVKELKENGFDGDIISWTRGVDRDVFKPTDRQDHNTLNLVCVSRVSKEKNLEKFFEMEYPNSKKTMVGDGPMLETYKKKYPEVDFVGYKTGHDLAHYYQQADVFVFPSEWETFGLVMIEAMACGTPVAAYPVNGPLDVIDQGITGYMDNDLAIAVQQCAELSRDKVLNGSMRWSWDEAWKIFKDHLLPVENMV